MTIIIRIRYLCFKVQGPNPPDETRRRGLGVRVSSHRKILKTQTKVKQDCEESHAISYHSFSAKRSTVRNGPKQRDWGSDDAFPCPSILGECESCEKCGVPGVVVNPCLCARGVAYPGGKRSGIIGCSLPRPLRPFTFQLLKQGCMCWQGCDAMRCTFFSRQSGSEAAAFATASCWLLHPVAWRAEKLPLPLPLPLP